MEALRTLADLGCPMAEKEKDGSTAADLAAALEQFEAVQVLVKELGCPAPSLPVRSGGSSSTSATGRSRAATTRGEGACSSDQPAVLRRLRRTLEHRAEIASSSGGVDASAGRSSATAAVGEESGEGEVGSCAVCLDGKATWVFEACGHRCICKACARKQKEKMPGTSGASAKKKGRKKGGGALTVNCPLCRAQTRVVPVSRYSGDVFG